MAHATRPRTLDPDNLAPLEAWLKDAVGASALRIRETNLLSGGAVGENWRLSVKAEGGRYPGDRQWVLRTDAHSRVPMSLNRAQEFACLLAAQEAGVAVPEPIAACAEDDIVGASFLVTGFLSGEAQARRIVRDPAIDTYGEPLAEEVGAALARLHTVRPPRGDLSFLAVPGEPPGRAQVAILRDVLDGAQAPRPALEYVLCWLEDNAPPMGQLVLCHSDYRTGNYLVDDGRLTGILDWEFAHWSDPQEDLGWFCARCWRFGADDKEAGGIASKAALYRGYNSIADQPLDPDNLAYWEILAAARWAVIALLQGERHLSGREPSLELMLTGLMSAEMEYDALAGIASLSTHERPAAHG